MKKILIIMLVACAVSGLGAQPAEGFKYQSVVRSPSGEIFANRSLSYRFSILRSSETGEAVYVEHRPAATNADGWIELIIGFGEPSVGQFSAIDWTQGPYYMKTEIDLGEGFTLLGVQELISVPYALNAETAGTVERTSPNGTLWRLAVGNEGDLSAEQVEEQIVPIPAGYSRLVFQDEFNGTGLPDPAKWGYEEGYVRNGEKQYYTVGRLENCSVSDGCLYIRCLNDSALVENAKVRTNSEVRKDTIVPVTSASIHTKDKASWKYCRVEVRAKLPLCLGTWPAIWMMPQVDTYGYWPSSGEIDIMEHVGYMPEQVHFTLHCATYNSGTATNPRNHSVNCYNVNTQFHVYAVEWKEDQIEFFVDGLLKFRVKKKTTDTWREWPFYHPFYLILNSGFGGSWGGQQGINLAGLPQDYVIDYVRVFQ